MDWYQHLKEQLKQDYELLKELEEKLRYENDPRLQGKWKSAIRDVKQQIDDRKTELQFSNNQSITSQSQEVDKSRNTSSMTSSFNQRKMDRLYRDLDLVKKQSDELTEVIDVIVDEISENREDFVRVRNLNKKKKRYEEERNKYDQELEKIQADIDRLMT